MRGMTKRAPALLFAALLCGCMTYDTRSDAAYDGPRIYSGTRLAASQVGHHFMNLNVPWVLIYGVDLPFSFVADTVLLPVTITEERRRRAELTEKLQTAEERPSVISVRPGTPPVDAAKMLFEACVQKLERYDPLLTDCFSTSARIHYDTGEPRILTGAQYKHRVRRALAVFQTRSEFVTWRHARYTAEDANVRIEVDRSSSERGELGTLVLLAGPTGEDRGWRILEMLGATWR
jgi:uncharacterized protein YceK